MWIVKKIYSKCREYWWIIKYTLKELIYNNNTIEIKNYFKSETKYNFSKMSKWIDTKYFEMFRNLQLLIITIYINKIESNQLRKISLLI